jgi:hypothetical protein
MGPNDRSTARPCVYVCFHVDAEVGLLALLRFSILLLHHYCNLSILQSLQEGFYILHGAIYDMYHAAQRTTAVFVSAKAGLRAPGVYMYCLHQWWLFS